MFRYYVSLLFTSALKTDMIKAKSALADKTEGQPPILNPANA